MNPNKIIWKAQKGNLDIASFRIRSALPAYYLERLGWHNIVIEEPFTIRSLDGVHSIIFVKSFSHHDLKLAQQAKSLGINVHIDICDNILSANYPKMPQYECFKEITEISDSIITTGEELKKFFQNHFPKSKIEVIPDQVENLEILKDLEKEIAIFKARGLRIQSFWFFRFAYSHSKNFSKASKKILLRVRNKLQRLMKVNPPIDLNSHELTGLKTVIWFGNSGGGPGNFGIQSLADIAPELMSAQKKHPFKLKVISNSYAKYVSMIKPLPIPSEYVKWTFKGIFHELKKADVCLVPNSKDDFSIFKSPNRSLLALSLDVPVVATYIPSLESISPYILHDNWEENIVCYLSNPEKARLDTEKSKKVLIELYSGTAIANKWNSIFINPK